MAFVHSARSRARRLPLVLAIVLAIISLAAALLRHAGQWLVREDPLAKSDVIVVLSGGMPYRAEEAARIYAMGYAPQVWVSYPLGPGGDLASLGIHYVGEEEYNRDVLIRAGVPRNAVHIFPEPILNTQQEVREVSGELQRTGKVRVIFVTSPEHTRRVKTLWRKLNGRTEDAIVRSAPKDPFDSVHWWRSTRDALAVVREYLGLMNAWAGFPVRPQ
jgi:uncharacterized SAM-binding protein YcdF (DUF218 family)